MLWQPSMFYKLRLLWRAPAHREPVVALAFSRDASKLATAAAAAGAPVRLWAAPTGAPDSSLQAPGPPAAIAFHGAVVDAAPPDAFPPADPPLVALAQRGSSTTVAMAVSGGGIALRSSVRPCAAPAPAPSLRSACVADPAPPEQADGPYPSWRHLEAPEASACCALALSATGDLLVWARRDGSVWAARRAPPGGPFGAPTPARAAPGPDEDPGGRRVTAVAASPDGRRVAWCAADGSVWAQLWQEPTGAGPAPPAPLLVGAHTAAPSALAFMPGGETLVSGGADKAVRMWALPPAPPGPGPP
eukprot:tig00000194_g14782.t1